MEWIVSGRIIKTIVTNRNGIPESQYAVPVPLIRVPLIRVPLIRVPSTHVPSTHVPSTFYFIGMFAD